MYKECIRSVLATSAGSQGSGLSRKPPIALSVAAQWLHGSAVLPEWCEAQPAAWGVLAPGGPAPGGQGVVSARGHGHVRG